MRVIKLCLIATSLFIFVICVFVKFLPKYIDIETRGYEALQIMGNHGIIENEDRLNDIMNDTDFGKKIENADYLSYILRDLNKHSKAYQYTKSSEEELVQEESISLPTLSKVGSYNVITIPGIYSLSESTISTYINTLSNLIEESKENIVLDLSNNPGGDVVPMLLGARSLIPDGLIFKGVDHTGNRSPVYLSSNKLKGGISNVLELESDSLDLPMCKKTLNKKVAIIISEKTGSAAEALVLALKHNKNIKVFGTPSAGYTSWNLSRELSRPDIDSIWVISYTIGYFEVNYGNSEKDKQIYNNKKIKPDIEVKTPIFNEINDELITKVDNFFKKDEN